MVCFAAPYGGHQPKYRKNSAILLVLFNKRIIFAESKYHNNNRKRGSQGNQKEDSFSHKVYTITMIKWKK